MNETALGQQLDTDKTADRIKELLVQHLGVDPQHLTDQTMLEDDLGVDSLDCIEVAMALEEEFEILILDEDMEEVETVQDLVDLVVSEISEKAR